jgi:hypothetical protein
MKIIINNISIYHIHDNKYYNNGQNNHLNVGVGKVDRADPTDFCSHVVVNDNIVKDNQPLITELRERILQSELEVKELLDKLNNETA